MNMKQIAKMVSASVVAIFIVACASTVDVKPIKSRDDISAGDSGLYYWLPKSLVRVTIPVTFYSASPSDFKNDPAFETKMKQLNIKPFDPKKPSITGSYFESEAKVIKVGKPNGVVVSVPDKSEMYFVDLSAEFWENKELTLTLTDQGLLSAGLSKATDMRFDYLVTTFEQAVSIAGAAGFGAARVTSVDLDTAFKSYEAAVKDKENAILSRTGDIQNVSKENLEYRLKRMDEVVLGRLNQLRGAVSSKTVEYVFEIDPTEYAENGRRIPLFSYRADGSGISRFHLTPVKPRPAKEDDTGGLDDNVVSVEITPSVHDHTRLAASIEVDAQNQENGFVYRVPAPVDVRILKGETQLARSTAMIAQWGAKQELPQRSSSQSASVDFSLFTETGAMKTVKVGRTGFTAQETVGRVGGATTKLVEAANE